MVLHTLVPSLRCAKSNRETKGVSRQLLGLTTSQQQLLRRGSGRPGQAGDGAYLAKCQQQGQGFQLHLHSGVGYEGNSSIHRANLHGHVRHCQVRFNVLVMQTHQLQSTSYMRACNCAKSMHTPR